LEIHSLRALQETNSSEARVEIGGEAPGVEGLLDGFDSVEVPPCELTSPTQWAVPRTDARAQTTPHFDLEEMAMPDRGATYVPPTARRKLRVHAGRWHANLCQA
jgi:hypothetical protein